MNRLIAELQRLYFLPGQLPAPAQPLNLVSSTGMVRAMVVGFRHSDDWAQVASLYQRLGNELDWPAPAVFVAGDAGYGLWFSLAEPAPLAEVASFLAGLQRRYLADMPASAVLLWPMAGALSIMLPPACDPASGRWSAFIDPSMGSMFIDEAGLDMQPNADKQADLLAGLTSASRADFLRASALLNTAGTCAAAGDAATLVPSAAAPASNLLSSEYFSDPQRFLMAVMNDPLVDIPQRIEAAKALLSVAKNADI